MIFGDTLLTWAITIYSQMTGMSFEAVTAALAENNEVVTMSVRNIMLVSGI